MNPDPATCAGKVRHETRDDALAVLGSMKRRGFLDPAREKAKGPLHAYRCPACGGFHLGHRGNRRGKESPR